MSDILTLVNEMRNRVGMYIGTPSVIRLAAFLRGYDYALFKLDGRVQDDFLTEFRDWIQARFQSTMHSWEDLILMHSQNDADSLTQFWKLLDEFQSQRIAAQTNGVNRAPVSAEK